MQEGLIDDMSIFGDINVINVFVADLISSLLMSYGELNTRKCACVPVNCQALLWRKQYHMSQRHSGAFLCHSCLQLQTNSG